MAIGEISARTVAAAAPALLVLLGCLIAAVADVWRGPTPRYMPRIVWTAVIFAMVPWGVLAYLFLGRRPTGSVEPAGAADAPADAGLPPWLRAAAADADPTADAGDGATATDAAGAEAGDGATGADDGPGAGDGDGDGRSELDGGDTVVRTRGLVRDYGGTGVLGVDLAVPRRGIYGLVGPNGSGKTTLLAMVSGLRRSDRGHIDLGVSPARIAVCPDVPEFEPWLTAREVVELARHLAADRRSRNGADTQPGSGADGQAVGAPTTDELLAAVGLADAADRRVAGFSRGMSQRLGLAVGLVTDPELIILDEPTSALDPAGRADIIGLLSQLGERTAVLLSSHDLSEIQQTAATIGVMHDGRLAYQGPTDDLVDTVVGVRWLVRVRADAAAVAGALHAEPWVVAAQATDDDTVTVEVTSAAAAETGLVRVLAATGARVVGIEPAGADLEGAFLALTRSERVA